MSILTRSILERLNEAEAVKKPYGDKPEEGKKEKLERGKKASIPKGKTDNKVKAEKLQNVNKEAPDAYANDTERVMSKADDKNHSDKGKVAKTTGKKADRTIKYPFGDKPEASDSKLVKESAEVEECDGQGCEEKKEECDKPLKEDYDNGTWQKHQEAIENEMEAAKADMDEGAFEDFCDGVINLVKNYTGEFDQFEGDKVAECDKVVECDKADKEEK